MCQYNSLIKAIDCYIKKADDELKETLSSEGYTDPDGSVEEINKIEDKISDSLDAQTQTFLQSLQDAAEQSLSLEVFLSDIWPEIKANDEIGSELMQLFFNEFSDMLPNLVNNYLQETDKDLVADQITKRTTDWIQSWSEDLSNLMKLNSQDELEKVLTDGLNDGKGIDEITQDIIDNGIRDTRFKARRTAITETLRAHSYAREESIKQSPAATGREWVHTGAYRNEPRQNHVDMDGKTASKDEPFELIGKDGSVYHPMFPRDIILPASESVNCHCLHRAVVDEEVLGLSLAERKRLQAEAIAADDDAWEAELEEKNKAKAGIEEA